MGLSLAKHPHSHIVTILFVLLSCSSRLNPQLRRRDRCCQGIHESFPQTLKGTSIVLVSVCSSPLHDMNLPRCFAVWPHASFVCWTRWSPMTAANNYFLYPRREPNRTLQYQTQALRGGHNLVVFVFYKCPSGAGLQVLRFRAFLPKPTRCCTGILPLCSRHDMYATRNLRRITQVVDPSSLSRQEIRSYR